MTYVTVRGKRYRRCEPVWGSCRLKEGHKGQHDAYARGGKRRLPPKVVTIKGRPVGNASAKSLTAIARIGEKYSAALIRLAKQ